MTYSSKPQIVPHSAAASVPALHSLRNSQIALATAALPVLGAGWSLDIEADYLGDRCLMITPPAAQDDGMTAEQRTASDLTYVVWSDSDDRIMLARVVDETWEGLGRFEQIGDAIRAIAAIRRGGRS